MDKETIDRLIGGAVELKRTDAWLVGEMEAGRALLAEKLAALRAACEAEPEWRDYVTRELKNGIGG